MKNKGIYFDNAATTQLDTRVLDAMIPYFIENYGNASSMHDFGSKAKVALLNSRKTIADAILALPEEIIFTSSGTEANNLALKGVALANRSKRNHIIVSSIEHDCILNTSHFLEEEGFRVTYLPVDSSGIIDPKLLEDAIRPDTLLASVMHVNNEIGTIQPLEEIGEICHQNGVLFHSDACQSFGKIPINVLSQNIDLLTLNAHKMYGPKGVGALYIRKETKINTLLHGGGQESGLRSSTENIPAIAGFAKSTELCIEEMATESKRIQAMRDYLAEYLFENYADIYINGSQDQRLYNNLNFSIHGLEGETIRLLLLLDEMVIAVSAGSACSSNDKSNNTSHVLKAIGLNQFEARGAVRVTFGRYNTMEEVKNFTQALGSVISQLKSIF